MRPWLKNLRESKGLSQAKLADEVGVTVTAISKYEAGERSPKPIIAKKIAEVLGFDWTKFFDNDCDVKIQLNDQLTTCTNEAKQPASNSE